MSLVHNKIYLLQRDLKSEINKFGIIKTLIWSKKKLATFDEFYASLDPEDDV